MSRIDTDGNEGAGDDPQKSQKTQKNACAPSDLTKQSVFCVLLRFLWMLSEWQAG
jgi:hypothetical protein